MSRKDYSRGGDLYGLRCIPPRLHVPAMLKDLELEQRREVAHAKAKRQKKGASATGSVLQACACCGAGTTVGCSVCMRPLCYAYYATPAVGAGGGPCNPCWSYWHQHDCGKPTHTQLKRQLKQ